MKNQALILDNILEAKEQLEEIENQIINDPNFDETEFKIAIEHAFHHLTFAWNIRNEDAERLVKFSDADFQEWSKVPDFLFTKSSLRFE